MPTLEDNLRERLRGELGMSEKAAGITSELLTLLAPPGVAEAVGGEDITGEEAGLMGVLAGAIGKKARRAKKLAARGLREIEGGLKNEPRDALDTIGLASKAREVSKFSQRQAGKMAETGDFSPQPLDAAKDFDFRSFGLAMRSVQEGTPDSEKFAGAVMSQQGRQAVKKEMALSQQETNQLFKKFGEDRVKDMFTNLHLSQDVVSKVTRKLRTKFSDFEAEAFLTSMLKMSDDVAMGQLSRTDATDILARTFNDILTP